MLHIFCKSKINGLCVTKAELYYEGSITLDAALLETAGIREGEKVEVLNVCRQYYMGNRHAFISLALV